MRMLLVILLLSLVHAAPARAADADDLPIVPEGFAVDVIAKEPMVSNPCVMAFDRRGRLFVGQGQQWRSPKPETPGDRVDILIDDNGDGIADRRKTFAEGFNCIQGLAWKGRDLWVANAPDLTIVRDLDGDDEADEYIRVYTGLGNLEHALHGLNFGPDGKLYMSKGNSKGYNRLDQLAPKPFRELWGLPSPQGAPDYTPVEVFKKGEYQRKYHTPPDDWGRQGGILRCDPDGRNLEIVASGFRNPWDIAFDDGFNWLGTDNDQTEGDKIFAPFFGAHFGWGHAWSSHWSGENHQPTVPASAPLFQGSGAGVVHYHASQFPPIYRDVFYVNDWMRREIYLFRPKMNGALMACEGGFPPTFASAGGGRTLPSGSGRVFEPTDIEVGPDGALYVLSWGHAYGATIKDGKQVDAGRVYRIRYKANPLARWKADHRDSPLADWTLEQLFADLGSSIPAWRTDAQDEFVRRGAKATPFLMKMLGSKVVTRAQETWTIWTLGQIAAKASEFDAWLVNQLAQDAPLNRMIQSLRVLAERHRRFGDGADLPRAVLDLLKQENAVVRHEAVQAIWQARATGAVEHLLDLADRETDRIVFYSAWNALRDLALLTDRMNWLDDKRAGVRLAALLGLFADDALTAKEVLPFRQDGDARIADLVKLWLQKAGGAPPKVQVSPPPATAEGYRQRAFITQVKAKSGRDYHIDWTGLSKGKHHYTDRQYQITDVPAALEGLPFMRTANDDDRTIDDAWLTFESDQDVTVMVGIDARNPGPMAWMKVGQKDGFRDTGLKLSTTDPTFRLYEKKFSAGRIVLGANMDTPNDSRRGNYIVIFKSPLLSTVPREEAVTVEQVLAAMKQADATRGRDLFLHPLGAGCYKCHQLEGRGNVFAPDLSDIGSRGTPEAIARSILHPSEVITEGFSQQIIETEDGDVHTGIVLRESGREIQLALSDGRVVPVKRDVIISRRASQLSAMPDNFGKLMSARQLADLIAYLKTHTSIGDPNGFSFSDKPDRIDIRFGDQPIATYLKQHDTLTRRALVSVKTPGGIQVTRDFPPRASDDIDHAHMHPGIWISYGDFHGNDYWRLKSAVRFDGFVEPLKGDRTRGHFAVRNQYMSQDGKQTVCTEISRYEYRRVADGFLLLIDAVYQSKEHDFYFGDQEESGLAVRVASPLRVEGGKGTILNDRGERNGSEFWGKEAKWFDYHGPIDGREVGIMVVPDPRNARPSWLHARDYGVVVTNPFPKQPKERREPYVKTWVKKGETFRLRYAVLIHETPQGRTFDRAAAYRNALEAMKP